MRNLILMAFLSTISLLNAKAQNQKTMVKQIKETVTFIESAAANRDVKQLAELLHEDYRVVANRFKGSKTATVLSKEVYLEMMKNEKVGGTTYDIQYNDIKITGHTAIVDLLYRSDTTSDMHKYLILIQDEDNQWKVVSDIPIIME